MNSCHNKRQTPLELREDRCDMCRKTLRREADKARHKCLVEQQKPVQDQWDAAQCCYYLLYQLGTGGCTQKAEPVRGVYP